MYKDKDKQKEANRKASQRRRDKGMTQGITNQGMTVTDEPPNVIPAEAIKKAAHRLRRGKDIKCFEDLHPGIQATIIRDSTDKDGKLDEGEKSRRTTIAVSYQHLYPERYEPKSAVLSGGYQLTASERANYKPASELKPGEYNHVSKPGDKDYVGVCT